MDEVQKENEPKASEATITDLLVSLPSGLELDPLSAKHIASNKLTKLVVLAGPIESGKTTLLLSIYEAFQHGQLGPFQFSGSETLTAFEARCHSERLLSGNLQGTVGRTVLTEAPQLLHLRVRESGKDADHLDILVVDISGEEFEAAISSEEDARNLSFVRRADHFTMMFDGEKLCDPRFREKILADGRMLLRSLIEAENVGRWTIVHVLLTKLDVVAEKISSDEIAKLISRISDEMKRFGPMVGSLRYRAISAKPLNNPKGIIELFSDWVRDSDLMSIYEPVSGSRPVANRAIDRFGLIEQGGVANE